MTTLRQFSEIFGTSRATADLPKMAAAAAAQGFAVLPVRPNTKIPLCILTSSQARKLDTELGFKHQCGFYHAMTDPAEALRVFRRLQRVHTDLNIAIEVGRSRMILVDCDTAESVKNFSSQWKLPVPIHPTVYTPGTRDDDGNWIHKNGGHYWFDCTPHSFESAPTAAPVNKDGYQIYFKDRVALMPPSIRDTGEYRLASDLDKAPDWLIAQIQEHIEQLHSEPQRRTNDDPIDEWAAQHPWSEFLLADDWKQYQRDRCGCMIWTRPGDYSNPKSATAHEPPCARLERGQQQGPLHIWTDNPPDFLADYVHETGAKTISKLQYVAHGRFLGDISAAMMEYDIEPVHPDIESLLDDFPPPHPHR